MDDERNLILLWAERGRIDPARVEEAMRLTHGLPEAWEWRRFIDRLLLWGGTALVAAGVVYFIAFNWNLLGHFARFGLLEALIALSVAGAVWLGLERPAGKAALFAASIFVGALLALFGQIYQTGADSFELFVTWAVMILPWALAARHAPLWFLLVLLANVAIGLYFRAFHTLFNFDFGFERQLWALFAFNGIALAAWELVARQLEWMGGRWAPRTLAAVSGALVTTLAIMDIFNQQYDYAGLVVYLLWIGALYYIYRRRSLDLFMLAGGVLSGIFVVVSFLSETLLERGSSAALLLIGLVVIGLSGWGGGWLMTIAREEPHESR